MRKKTAAAALAAAIALGGGAAVTAPGIALAASSDSSTSTAAPSATDRAAARLTAIGNALKGLVTDGTLTQAQADKVASTLSQANLDLGGHGRGGALTPDVVAQVLGITTQQLHDAQAQGQTLAQIAEGRGISRADLISKLKSAATAKLDADLKAGTITQAQHDQAISGLDNRIAQRVDQVRTGNPGAPSSGSSSTATPAPAA